ncbi:SDR family oxidoreductase [Novosphingobium sp. TH158]|uniref:SDR family oxidoreductase n=1 Tax=Novosphingobium sp. TH158 TaxID=2067455 RepID=UPI000C7B3287|nr:SDR family oxidoreductase [Novosphingobium sp. TH158]PLK26748.1 NAD(P)-dependent oxidoreductase [Novosphingobium sp. TH158]
MELKGKTAFITGGASGIGLAVAHALAGAGLRVAIADIDGARLDQVAGEFPGEVEPVVLDVRDRAMWQAARERVEGRFGPVSVLMNNAGIINDSGDAIEKRGLVDQSPESWDMMIGINLTGVYNGIHTFGPAMRDRGEGHIVNTSSTQGVISARGVASYCAGKFGVVALSECLRDELAGNGVGVSVLCPGVVATRLSVSSRMVAGQEPRALIHYGIEADTVAAMVLEAIRANRLYIFTHGEYAKPVAERHARVMAGFDGVPVSSFFDPSRPLPGTPEFFAAKAALEQGG